jgi:Rhs element Vgr protein
MEVIKAKIAGEDYSKKYSSICLSQYLGTHHTLEVMDSEPDTSSKFKGIISRKANELIGKSIEISMGENKFKGCVSDVSLSRIRRETNEISIHGGSPTLLMEEGPTTCSFYEQTVKEIVDKVLQPYSSHFTQMRISPSSKEKIKYTVQYKESNFQFLSRLAAQHGDWFYFDGEDIFFGPKPSRMNPIKLYQDANILSFHLSIKTVPVNFKLMAYDYKKHAFLQKETDGSDKMGDYAKIAYHKSKEAFFTHAMLRPVLQSMGSKELDQLKSLKQKAQLTEMVVLSGASTETQLRIGSYVQLIDERNELLGGKEEYGTFIVVQVKHFFEKEGTHYSNTFEAVPSEVSTPPIFNAFEPPFSEMQLAEVKDVNDPDSLGRIKVQFSWQRSTDHMSPWIRVVSPYAGNQTGFYFVPEIGDQVLVAFEENHPERPYVLGSLYHGESKPENFQAKNYLKGIKTKGANVILLNDEKDKESVAVTSPKDISITGTDGKITITGKDLVTIESKGKDIQITSAGTITIQAKKISLKADEEISMEAPKIQCKADADFKVEAGNVTHDAQGENSVKGLKVNVSGSVESNISGGMIKLNS